MDTSLLSHLTSSALVVWSLQYLKRTEWYPKLAHNLPIADKKVHVAVSGIGAFCTAVGMHAALTGNWKQGYEAVLHIPPLIALAHAAWDTANQLALNQLIFTGFVKEKSAAPVLTQQVTPRIAVTTPIHEAPEAPKVLVP